MTCVCGKGPSTEECCKPIIDGERQAETAEELMRSRYAAYVLEEIDYVVESHAPEGRDEIDREGAEKWAKEADWEGLEIVSTEAGGPDDDTGKVEFIARYAVGGGAYAHHEKAEFEKIDGRWFYTDGEMVKAKPVRRAERKVGRNEPCPCGSGKKYKKCCGAAA